MQLVLAGKAPEDDFGKEHTDVASFRGVSEFAASLFLSMQSLNPQLVIGSAEAFTLALERSVAGAFRPDVARAVGDPEPPISDDTFDVVRFLAVLSPFFCAYFHFSCLGHGGHSGEQTKRP